MFRDKYVTMPQLLLFCFERKKGMQKLKGIIEKENRESKRKYREGEGKRRGRKHARGEVRTLDLQHIAVVCSFTYKRR